MRRPAKLAANRPAPVAVSAMPARRATCAWAMIVATALTLAPLPALHGAWFEVLRQPVN